jgi:hypothetical protein
MVVDAPRVFFARLRVEDFGKLAGLDQHHFRCRNGRHPTEKRQAKES